MDEKKKKRKKGEKLQKRSFPGIRSLAEQGNPEIQGILGFMYLWGIGTPKNPRKAIRLFKIVSGKRNKKWNARINAKLGKAYGRQLPGFETDMKQSIFWTRKAAELGGYSI